MRPLAEDIGDIEIEAGDPALIERLFGFGCRDHLAQAIAGLQQRLNGLGGDGADTVAHFVEQRLHAVGKVRDRGKAKGRRAAVDGMGGAEDGVDAFAVRGRSEGQEARFHCIQPFPALLEEDLGDFRHFQIKDHARFLRHMFFEFRCGCQMTRATVARSCGGLNGLTIQPVAPARLPSIFFS